MRDRTLPVEASVEGRRVVESYQSDLKRLCVALRREGDVQAARARRAERRTGPPRERPLADA